MRPTATFHDVGRVFSKAYRDAAIGFGIILGLNTAVLLGIGVMQFRNENPEFGPPMLLIGMGTALAGLTIAITAAIAHCQRWGAIAGLVVMLLTAFAAIANFVVEAGAAGGTKANPGCGGILFIIAIILLVKAIGAKPPLPPVVPAAPVAAPPGLAPYGFSPFMQVTGPRKIQTSGMALLIIGGLMVIGGASVAATSWITETTVSDQAWQTVTDATLGISVDMPGNPKNELAPPSAEVTYEMTYSFERHQYSVAMTCIRLPADWYYEEHVLVGNLESQFEPAVVASKSTTLAQINGVSWHRVHYRLKDGGQAYALGFVNGRDAVVVIVVESSGAEGAVADRVINSLRKR